jgi:MFS family permease
MILGFSLADRYPWISIQVLGLLIISLAFWGLFLWIELRAEEPILEPQVFTNRTFLTAAVAALLSFFGAVGIVNFYPLFLQGVQGTSATLSGAILTPFTMLMAFVGVPTGLLIAKTKHYKWMFVLGYAVLTIAMFCTVAFSYETPVWAGFLVMFLAGLGGGAIPTVNILVVQFALPKRLLGMAVAAIFFVVALGNAITPAILGTAMNFRYEKQLQLLLPEKLSLHTDAATMELISDPRVLMSQEAVTELRDTLNAMEYQEPNLYARTVEAIRKALQSGLKLVFLIGAVTMLLSFLFIATIPRISMDSEVIDKRHAQ